VSVDCKLLYEMRHVSSCWTKATPSSNSFSMKTPDSPLLNRRSVLGLLGACAATPVFAQSSDFQSFLRSLRAEARAAGVSDPTFSSVIENLTLDSGPVAASRKQGEFTRPFWDYVNGAVSAARLNAGRAAAARVASDFAWVERNLGVGKQVVAGIWGMESNFGTSMGDKDVLRSTASLAFSGTRAEFYRKQFIAALKILDEGHITRDRMIGSWAGAMGQTQFIPTSFLKYAVDGDGDGRKNIWTSTRDALASAANHLKLDGWVSGLPWGFEVALPANFDWTYSDRTARHAFSQWSELGVRRLEGDMPRSGGAGLFLPAGMNGPALLVTDNFEVIREYNTSDSYAVGVGHLGDRIFGGSGFKKAWPTSEPQLNNTQISELQRLLQAKGHPMGTIDGRIGKGTRKAVQAAQRGFGMVPDGHPSPAVLARLRGG
jgi:membrane-bound lytic murein transglycosylase B